MGSGAQGEHSHGRLQAPQLPPQELDGVRGWAAEPNAAVVNDALQPGALLFRRILGYISPHNPTPNGLVADILRLRARFLSAPAHTALHIQP